MQYGQPKPSDDSKNGDAKDIQAESTKTIVKERIE